MSLSIPLSVISKTADRNPLTTTTTPTKLLVRSYERSEDSLFSILWNDILAKSHLLRRVSFFNTTKCLYIPFGNAKRQWMMNSFSSDIFLLKTELYHLQGISIIYEIRNCNIWVRECSSKSHKRTYQIKLMVTLLFSMTFFLVE